MTETKQISKNACHARACLPDRQGFLAGIQNPKLPALVSTDRGGCYFLSEKESNLRQRRMSLGLKRNLVEIETRIETPPRLPEIFGA